MANGVPLGSAFGSIGLDLGPLRAAVAGVRSATGQMEQAFSATSVTIVRSQQQTIAALDRVKGTLSLQQRQYAILKQEVEKVAQAEGAGSLAAQKKQLALDKLSQSIANNNARLNTLEAELQQTTAALSTAGSGAGSLVSRFEEMRGGVERASQSLLSTGAVLSGAVTAPMALLGSQALTTAADYEQAMSLFQANTQATAEQMARAGETAKDLGADLSLPGASAADAGEVMLELAKAGLSVDDALTEARGTMALAATEALDNAEAATIAAGAYNTFREEGLRVAQVADILAAGSSASSASVRSLSQGLQQAGSGFAAAHIPMRDLVAQMSLMANAGVQGSDAGTSLKTMLQKLQGPTDKARDAMRDLGISIYDQQGAMLPMRDLVGQFSEKLAGLTQEERDAAIVTIFGSDAQRAANIVLAGGVEQYDKMVEAVGRSGAASELAGARMKGLSGAVEGFKSTVETALLEAVEPFLPALADLINAASAAVSAFAGLPEPVRNAALAFAAVLAAAGPVLLAIGGVAAAAATVSAPMLAAAAGVAALAGALASGNPIAIGAAVAIAAYVAAQQFGAVAAAIPVIAAQTAALAANAAAALAASGPFIVLGAAVAGATIIYQKWKNIASDAAAKALTDETRRLGRSYQDAERALARYGEASAQVRDATRRQADELRQLQAEQERDVQARADAAAQGDKDAAWWDESNARVRTRIDRMNELTAALGENMTRAAEGRELLQEQATAEERAAQATARRTAAELAAAGDVAGALIELRRQAGLTDEEIEQLGKDLEKAAAGGATAFRDAVSAEAGFLTEREQAVRDHTEEMATLSAELAAATTDAERQAVQDRIAAAEEGYKEQEAQAAEAYARQQAAQLAHLGQMLIDYATAQATMAGVSAEKIAAMTTRLAAEYGVQQSLVDRSFGAMTGSIDAWVANGGEQTDRYIDHLGRIQDETVALQQEVDRQISTMTEQARGDFEAGKIDIDQYVERLQKIPGEAEQAAAALRGIPTRIESTVTVTTVRREVGTGNTADATSRTTTRGAPGASGTRALGGPVKPYGMYEVVDDADKDPELLAVGGKTFLLMGAKGGTVIPALQAAGAAMGTGLAGLRSAAGDLATALPQPRQAGTFATPASAGPGSAGRGITVNLTVPVTIASAIIDNAERIRQVGREIAGEVRGAIGRDLSQALDRHILGGGTT